MVIPRELQEYFCPLLTCDQHVYLFIAREHVAFTLAEVVDGLLWISPHASLSIGYSRGSMYKFSFQVWNIFHA